jgi:hypothetical protein
MTSGIARARSLLARHRLWRGVCLLLAFALTCLTWPQWEVHVHASADHTHPLPLDHEEPALAAGADSSAGAHVHVHDAHAPSFMLSARSAMLARAPSGRWHAVPGIRPATYPAWPPPQRPPIA